MMQDPGNIVLTKEPNVSAVTRLAADVVVGTFSQNVLSDALVAPGHNDLRWRVTNLLKAEIHSCIFNCTTAFRWAKGWKRDDSVQDCGANQLKALLHAVRLLFEER